MSVQSTAARTCRICGERLNVHQHVRGICDNANCRSESVKRWLRERKAEEQARQNRLAAQALDQLMLDQLMSERCESPASYPYLVTIASNQSRVEALPDTRRESFVTHLRAIAGAVTSDSIGAEGECAQHPDAPHAAVASALAAACATCQGHCCRSGGDSAYIDAQTFARVLREEPALAVDDLAARYMAALPAVSVEGSCVFHTQSGCSLPRTLRSSICNEYLCSPLREWLMASPRSVPKRAAIVIVDAERVLRAALTDSPSVTIAGDSGDR